MRLSLITLLLLISTPITFCAFSTKTCSAKHCSPSFCTFNNGVVCGASEMPRTDYELSDQIKSISCKQCNQSADPRCTTENLASIFGIGMTNVKAAYCNDAFLVVWSQGLPHHQPYVKDIPNPPGTNGCLLRSITKQSQTYKIPLKPKLLADGKKNVLPSWPNHGIPMAGAIGVAKNGVPIYPSLDASDKDIWTACEADLCNAHGREGADYHYHGDPYGPGCLYTEKDIKNNHPGLIGFSIDGYSIYGRYTKASLAGESVALDDCGGHSHGSFGYHYHTQVEETASFTKFWMGPKLCWKGDILTIPKFWDKQNRQAEYDNSKTRPPFTITDRNDVEEIKPCCQSTKGYLNVGIILNGSTLTYTSLSNNASSPGVSPGSMGGGPRPPPSLMSSNMLILSYLLIGVLLIL